MEWSLTGFIGSRWILLGFTWFLPSWNGSQCVFSGWYLVLPSFTGLYWVLSSGIELVFQFQLLRFYLIPTGLWGELRRHLHGVATEFVSFLKRNILPSFFCYFRSSTAAGGRTHAGHVTDFVGTNDFDIGPRLIIDLLIRDTYSVLVFHSPLIYLPHSFLSFLVSFWIFFSSSSSSSSSSSPAGAPSTWPTHQKNK